MTSLQPCPKCGALFDVSEFRPGQEFTCGACGTVVTARAPRPHARRRAPRAAPARRSNAVVLGAAGAVVVVAVLAVLVLGRGGGDAPSVPVAPAATPVEPVETLASLRAELRRSPPRWAGDYHRMAARLRALGGADAEAEARTLYAALVRDVDAHDVEARKFLGHVEFDKEVLGRRLRDDDDPIPESITNRHSYPFLDAVEEFHSRRWLEDEDEIEVARAAVKDMREHASRLRTDHQYRAADRIRANVANDWRLAAYNFETRWVAPYLLCYSSKERLSEYELRAIKDPAERKRTRDKMRSERKMWERVLDEKERIYTQLYAEFMRRYGERFGLKPLADKFGGRPDLPPGSRTYDDGAPLVIWIFSDREAFLDYHKSVLESDQKLDFVGGYFSPDSGWIFLFDEADEEDKRIFEVAKNVHEGVHQLQFWFTKQRNKWGPPRYGQTALSEGLAEYLGSVKMDKRRNLEWTGVNYGRLVGMQRARDQIKDKLKREYPLFTVERLVYFTSYAEMARWVIQNWQLTPESAMGLFYQQAWAFVYFLNEFDDGKYRDKFVDYLDAIMRRKARRGKTPELFGKVFGLADAEAWKRLEAEWEAFLRDDLMERDPHPYRHVPPDVHDWTR